MSPCSTYIKSWRSYSACLAYTVPGFDPKLYVSRVVITTMYLEKN